MPSKPTNTRLHKDKHNQQKGLVINFDVKSRSNYLRGFQKRKQQRREKAEEKLKKKAAEERVAERKEMREEVHNRWERAVKDMTEAFGNSEESDLLNLPAQKPHTADEGASVPERTEEKVFENEGDDDLFGGVMVTTSTSLFEEDSAAVDARIAELRHEVSKDHREPLTGQQSNKKIMTKREGGVKKFGTSKRIDKTLGKKKTVHKKGVKSKSKKKH
uniref:Nucleolar protein 12 n=1 Tax=Perkinsus chesapeaki TaxID=330153 RepID=A7YXP0_PERCH|nr:unknown [Perkinsus chesapeaki]